MPKKRTKDELREDDLETEVRRWKRKGLRILLEKRLAEKENIKKMELKKKMEKERMFMLVLDEKIEKVNL